MALNTRIKRKSVMAMGMPFLPALSPPDDNDLEDVGERRIFLGQSAGVGEAQPINYGSGQRRRGGISMGIGFGL